MVKRLKKRKKKKEKEDRRDMEVFGFLVSITHNSKIVGPTTQKLVWISIKLFPVFVSITQFSDFLMMSYGN